MKSVIMASIAAATLATSAMAADFDNNTVNLELYRDNLVFGVETTAGEATALSVDVLVLPHAVLGATADVSFGAAYGIETQDVTLSTAYNVSKEFNAVTAYGSLEAAYAINTGASNGDWAVTPTLGASYAVNEQLSAFGEVSYTWDASNDWAREGGVLEVGATYDIQDGLYVRPSVTRTFDTADNETNLALAIGVAF